MPPIQPFVYYISKEGVSQNTNIAVFFNIVQKERGAEGGFKGVLNNVRKLQNLVFWGIPNATKVQSKKGQPLYFFKYQSSKSVAKGNPLSTELFAFIRSVWPKIST